MQLPDGLGHLTYSTLVHPGDTWEEMRESLHSYLPRIKARVSPDAPFGVSLRLSEASVRSLCASPHERESLGDFLAREDLYVYTVNAFPQGSFKHGPVMEQVYEPDWSTGSRLSYTCAVADILAEISAGDVAPSIQTAPLAFRPRVEDAAYVQRFTDNVLRAVSHLIDLERATGTVVKLALEPEPACFLETTTETVEYFTRHLFTAQASRRLANLSGSAVSQAQASIRRHLGVVFDMGHQAVGFEDVGESLECLVSAGVPIHKLQAAAALAIPEVTPEVVEELLPFTETIYLSQTNELSDGSLTRFLTLSDAIESFQTSPRQDRSWRTHFHVPVFLESIGGFATTRSSIEQALAMHRRTPLSDHLEIETYTWDVLPDQFKAGDIVDYVVREIEWVRDQLDASPARNLGE